MAARRKPPKKTRKPKPEMLGTGIARKGADIIAGRKSQLAKQECIAMGGKWIGGKCKY